jgi:hypothetical protein
MRAYEIRIATIVISCASQVSFVEALQVCPLASSQADSIHCCHFQQGLQKFDIEFAVWPSAATLL